MNVMRPTAENHKPRRALTAVLAVLAVLLAASGVLSWMAFSDPYAGLGLEQTEPSDELLKNFALTAASGKEDSCSAGEMNAFLAYLFRKSDAGAEKKGVQFLGAAVAGGSGDSADVYLPVLYRGKRFGVVLNVTPSLETPGETLVFRVNAAHVGKLSVPPEWLLNKVESRLPAGFTRSGSTLRCGAPSISAAVLGVTASVSLSEFRMEDGFLKLSAALNVTVG